MAYTGSTAELLLRTPPSAVRAAAPATSSATALTMTATRAESLSAILRKASLLWAIPANKELLRGAFNQANRTARHAMTRYELRRHLNSCVLPELLTHSEVGALMTWIEPIREKPVTFETLEAKLTVLLDGLRLYSDRKSLQGYFDEKFKFGEIALEVATAAGNGSRAKGAAAALLAAPNQGAASPSASPSPSLRAKRAGMPLSARASPTRSTPGHREAQNIEDMRRLKEGIDQLGRRIGAVRDHQTGPNPLSPMNGTPHTAPHTAPHAKTQGDATPLALVRASLAKIEAQLAAEASASAGQQQPPAASPSPAPTHKKEEGEGAVSSYTPIRLDGALESVRREFDAIGRKAERILYHGTASPAPAPAPPSPSPSPAPAPTAAPPPPTAGGVGNELAAARALVHRLEMAEASRAKGGADGLGAAGDIGELTAALAAVEAVRCPTKTHHHHTHAHLPSNLSNHPPINSLA